MTLSDDRPSHGHCVWPPARKTIFLTVHHGFASRYLLRTDVLKGLRQAGHRIVVLTPNPEEEYFRREFQQESVEIAPLHTTACNSYLSKTRLGSLFQSLRAYVLGNAAKATTVHYRMLTHQQADRSHPLNRPGFRLLVGLLNRSAWLRRCLTWLEDRLMTPYFHADLFLGYQPDLVVTSTIYAPADICLIREARRHRVPTLCTVLSWDNPTTKGLAATLPDYCIAWTEGMKQELVQHQDVPTDRVFVGGIAHFDIYKDPDQLLSREELCRRLGLDPQQPILLFATWSPSGKGHRYNLAVAEILGEAVAQGDLPVGTQVVVRVHPIYFRDKDPVAELAELQEICRRYPALTLNCPQVLSRKLPLDMPAQEMRMAASLVYHSSVLLSFMSTMTLEAALCDTPAIHLAFNLPEDDDPIYRPSQLSEMNHIQRVLATGGVRFASSPSEMVQHINSYLADRSLDADGRQLIVQQECQPFDGQSGYRIAQQILQVLEKHSMVRNES